MAPVIFVLKNNKSEFITKVAVTSQHKEMLGQVLSVFKIKPDYNLHVMLKGQTLTQITTRTLIRLERVLKKLKPDMVLVHGDTTTTLAASLAAYYLKIPLGHVEAGLRSKDKFNPYPEELNRRLSDGLSDIYFAPTPTSHKNLMDEGINNTKIYITGNTVIDALHMALKRPYRVKNKTINNIHEHLAKNTKSKLILLTAHRRENFGTPLENICKAIKLIAVKHNNVCIAYPVHLNPNIKKPVNKLLGNQKNVFLLPPLDYLEFSNLMDKAYIIVTDSGGLQEEGPSLGKPVLVLRKVTERPEAVNAGTVRIAGTEKSIVFQEIDRLLTNKLQYAQMANAVNPYGDGQAAYRILEAIKFHFGFRKIRPSHFVPGDTSISKPVKFDSYI